MLFGYHRGVSPVKVEELPTDGTNQPKPHYEQMRELSDDEAKLTLNELRQKYPYQRIM